MNRFFTSKFFQKIVVPAMLAILLFLIAVFAFIIPTFERNAVQQKRNMLEELGNTAWSILDKYNQDAMAGLLSVEDAKKKAAGDIEALRYGTEDKDYFWITDMTPTMIMHPYVQELTGTSLQDYADPDGKRLFIEAVNIARTQGEGFINYKWQFMDDSTRIVPKLSFVKKYAPWDWIIGTGIYLDDVQAEISSLTRKLILILLGITLIIALIIFFVTWQSFGIENKRREAEEQLHESREKYKSLVESSTEGIILLLNGKISYANSFIQNWLQYDADEILALPVARLFEAGKPPDMEQAKREECHEVHLARKDGTIAEALLTIIPVRFAEKEGILLTLRDSSEHRTIMTELVNLKARLQQMSELSEGGAPTGEMSRFLSSLASGVMRDVQTVQDYCIPPVACPADASLLQAMEVMVRHESTFVLLMAGETCLGMVTRHDLVERLAEEGGSPENQANPAKGDPGQNPAKGDPGQIPAKRAGSVRNPVEGNGTLQRPASGFMRSPLTRVEGSLSLAEATAVMDLNKTSYLMVRGPGNTITGVLDRKDIPDVLLRSPEGIRTAVRRIHGMKELHRIRTRLPFLIDPLLRNLGETWICNRIIAECNEEITYRIIEDALRETGTPPVPFAFLSFGSAGRRELSFNSDQDNALVYQSRDGVPDESLQRYFLDLAGRICSRLEETGLQRCRGGFMASNKKWCRPVQAWKEYFTEWITNAEPENLLNVSVFFDFRFVYGSRELFTELEDFVFEIMQGRSAFFYFLAQSVSRSRPPVNVFGNIVTELNQDKEEALDLKNALAPLVMFARIYSLHSSLRQKGTVERIHALRSLDVLSAGTCEEFLFHYNFMMKLLLTHQSARSMSGSEVTNTVPLRSLTDMDQMILKKVFSRMNGYSEKLSASFMSAYKEM